MGGRWAVPGFDKKKYSSFEAAFAKGATYGQEILELYKQASQVKVSENIKPREDASDRVDPKTRSTTQDTVFNTSAEILGKEIKAVVIDMVD